MAKHRIKFEVSFVMDEMDDPNPEASAEIADIVLNEVLRESTAWGDIQTECVFAKETD